MHYWNNPHFIRRILLILDLVSNMAGFVLAMLLRFTLQGKVWTVRYYQPVFVLSLLLCVFFALLRRVRHTEYSLIDSDWIEIASHLVRDRVVQYICLILLLFMTRSIDEISRIVILLCCLFDILFSFLCRMVLRHVMQKSQEASPVETHYFLITTKEKENPARERLKESMPEKSDLIGIGFIDDQDPQQSPSSLLEKITFSSNLHIFVYLGDEKKKEEEEIVQYCRAHDQAVSVFQFVRGIEFPRSMVCRRGSYTTYEFTPFSQKGEIFGVRFTPSQVESAVFQVLNRVNVASKGRAGSLSGQYLCFSNVHTTVMAHDNPSYKEVLNGAEYVFADGNPIAKKLKKMGFEDSERVAGPDFMDAVFRATMDGKSSHYFYGSTQETIDRLQSELPRRYPGIRIAGAVSPPFRKETEEEDKKDIQAINESGATFVWIGLGAPKQENWMHEHKGQVQGVMLGVGAGFDFYAGTVKRAPKWMQKVGLEWFYRLLQDPARLANRYIVTNVKYLWYIVCDSLHRT